MAKLHVGAVDCSFNHCGWAFIEFDTKTKRNTIKATGIIDNSPKILPKGPTSVDDLLRCQRLFQRIGDQVVGPYLGIRRKKAFALEIPGGSQSSRAASTLGMARGILGSVIRHLLSNEFGIDHCVVYVKPSEVHKQATGKVKASKEDIMNYVLTKYPEITTTTKRGRTAYQIGSKIYTKGQFEHIADAIVIGELGLERLKKEIKK